MPRIPSLNQFPRDITIRIVPPPYSTEVRNVIILLHGIGDTEISSENLAHELNNRSLRYTVSIAIRGPKILPPLLRTGEQAGYRWSDDLLFNQITRKLDVDCGFFTATTQIQQVVGVLTRGCGFEPKSIFFFAKGQGAMAGFNFVTKAEREAAGASGSGRFGGFLSIGGGLPKEQVNWIPREPSERLETPVMLCGMSDRRRAMMRALHALNDRYAHVKYVQWQRRNDDARPLDENELYPIVRFLAERLQ